MEQFVPVFDPTTDPVRGMNSHMSPAHLPGGFFQFLQNVRWDKQQISVREGISLEAAAPNSGSDTFLGGTIVNYGDESVAFCATSNGGNMRVYSNTTSSGAWQSWVERTGTSGQWGNTRLTAPGKAFFAPLPGYDGTSAVLVQGGSAPLYIPINGSTETAVKVEEYDAPPSGYYPTAGFSEFLTVSTSAATASSSGANFVASISGSSPNQTFLWTFGSGYAVSDSATCTLDAGTFAFDSGAQAILILDLSEVRILDSVKIELTDGTSYYTVHDPANGLDNRVLVDVVGETYVVAFGISEHGSIANVRGLRVTVTSLRVSDAATMRVRGIMCGGYVPGTAQYATSFTNVYGAGTPYSGWESPGVVMRIGEAEVVTTVTTGSLGQSVLAKGGKAANASSYYGASVPDGFSFPISGEIYYEMSVPVFAPSSTDAAKGSAYVNIYRKDPGETSFTLVNYMQVAEYASSTWRTLSSVFGGTTAWGERATYTDGTRPEDKSLQYEMPDGLSSPPPAGGPMVFADKRLMVAADQGSGDPKQRNTVWVSWEDAPLRFRAVSDVNNRRSGYSARIGSEQITSFAKVSASAIGRDSTYVFTDRAMYSLLDGRVSYIVGKGAVAQTVDVDNNIYSLDYDFQLNRTGATTVPVSRYEVDSQIEDTPADRREYASIAVHRDRVHLALAGSASDNNYRVLVLNNVLGAWESLDVLPAAKSPQQFVVWRYSGASKLLYFSPTGAIYRYGGGTDDDGADIDVVLRTKTFQFGGFGKSVFGAVRVLADSKASGTLTAKWEVQHPVVTQTGTTTLVDASNYVWSEFKQTTKPNDPPMGTEGAAAYLEISVTTDNPFNIYGIQAKMYAGRGTGNR